MSWSWWVMLGCCTYVYEHVGWSQPGHVWRRAENATDGGLWEQPSGHSEVPAESWSSRQPQGGSANTWPVGSARSVTVTLFQQPDVCSCQLLLHQPVTAATAESLCTTIFFFNHNTDIIIFTSLKNRLLVIYCLQNEAEKWQNWPLTGEKTHVPHKIRMY